MRARIKQFGAVAGVCLAAMGALACATIMHGSAQEVGISSQPTGATITVDGQPAGTTPVTARLSRKDLHRVAITLSGYQTFEITTTRKTSGWVWGNIIFGGLIGLAVDAISGGLYEVRPEQISGQLAKSGAMLLEHDQLFVVLVREPDPSWRRIGQLETLRVR